MTFANFDAHPKAVVYASTVGQVSAAVKCASDWNVRVSGASGRHSYQGASVPDGFLVVDVSNMTQARAHRAMLVVWLTQLDAGQVMRPSAPRPRGPRRWTPS